MKDIFMDRQLVEEIIACLSGQRNLYYYYRDRYSLGLLRHMSRYASKGLNVAALKNSDYAPLLQKPRIKTILATLGKNQPTEEYWSGYDYDQKQEMFVLTLGLWGGEKRKEWSWKQTSRFGYNLVLQMNFSSEHDAQYAKLQTEENPFAMYCHPTSKKRNTMAWARIDLDLQSNSALIEEIQNDWLREVNDFEKGVARRLKAGSAPEGDAQIWNVNCSLKTAQQYCRFVRERYSPIWDEAMLWATISFLREEIGIRHIFYHSAESGKILKRIKYGQPPRSLYTDLPRRFCFVPTREVPEFLQKDKLLQKTLKSHPALKFFKMPELQAA